MRRLWMIGVLALLVGCSSGKKDSETAAAGAENKDAAVVEGATPPQPSASSLSAGVTPETQPMIQKATKLIAERKFGDAFEQLNAALKADPKCAAAYFVRAGILADAGQNASALNDFNKAVSLQPKQAEFYNGRGFFLLTRQKTAAAAADFARTVKLNPTHVQAYNNHGLALVSLQQYKAAIASFTEALKIMPKNADALNNRGFAYFQAENYDNAIADFDATLRVKPDYLNAYNNKGLLLYKLEQYEEAIAQFDECIQRDKFNAKYYRHRREANLKLEKEDEARTDLAMIQWLTDLARYTQIALKNPRQPEGWVQRANHLVTRGEFEAAIADFEKALKLDPKCIPAFTGRAGMMLQRGKFTEALAECEAALKIEDSEAVHSMRGDIYMKLEQYDRAIADFDKAQRFDQLVAQAYLQRSQLRREKGETAQADADLQHAVSLDPSLTPSGN